MSRCRFGRILLFVIAFAMLMSVVPGNGLEIFFSRAFAASPAEPVPEVFSLEPASLGSSRSAGLWEYALRETDGYAVVTGYHGDEDTVAVPAVLDGCDVVGIASNALPGMRRVTLHGNILFLAEDAFGEAKPEIIALNGTYGLYWASVHGCPYETGRDYDLVPGVIDYTDAEPYRVRKHGSEHVSFNRLEAMRLSVGSLFWMKDARGMEFFYRVTALTEDDGVTIAAVEIPERVSDAVINYETTVEVALTSDDFVPADGVTVEHSPLRSRSVDHETQSNETTFSVNLSGKTKRAGDTTGSSWKVTGKYSVTTKNTMTYTVRIQNGEIVGTEVVKNQSYEKTVSVSCNGLRDVMKGIQECEDALKKAADGKPVTEEENEKLKNSLSGKFGLTFDDTSFSLNTSDLKEIRKYAECLQKYRDDALADSHFETTKEIGTFKIQTPYFNMAFGLTGRVSVEGNITFTDKSASVTKEHYDFDAEQWVVDYSGSNASTDENGKSLEGQVKAKLTLNVEVSVGAFFVKNLSFSYEFGIQAAISKQIYIDTDTDGSGIARLTSGCLVATFDPVSKLTVDAGVWVGSDTGVKISIFDKTWTVKELCGRDHMWCVHMNTALDDNKVHEPDECPFASEYSIHYETKVGAAIPDKSVITGDRLTQAYNVNMNSRVEEPLAGAFLGWAWDVSDTTPTAAPVGGEFSNPDGSQPVIIRKSVTLYAVWRDTHTVHFDSSGGSAVPDQFIPAGGYAMRPKNPTKSGCYLLSWRDSDDNEWNFDTSPVNADITLHALWDIGDELTGGTSGKLWFGSIDEVSSDCIFDPWEYARNQLPDATDSIFTYELMESDSGVKGIRITGLKSNNIEHLVVPAYFLYNNPYDPTQQPEWIRVRDIASGAFAGKTSLRSVYFITEDGTQLDTDYLFQNCTNLEIVKMPALENGLVGRYAFSGCTNLKYVEVRPGVKAIGENAFAETGISWCFLPSGISSIGIGAFYNCVRLTEVSIGGSDLTVIPDGAFRGCTSLATLYLGNKITSIGNSAFAYCSSLPAISFGFRLTSIGYYAFQGCSSLTDLYIPDSVQVLEVDTNGHPGPYGGINGYYCNGPFVDCTGLKHISVGGVETLESGMLKTGSQVLESLTIRGTVKKIGNSALNSQYAYSTGYTNNLGSGYDYEAGSASLIIEDGVEEIGEYAFYNCKMFTSVSLPSTISCIRYNAFYDCSRMTGDLDLHDIAIINERAFYNCSSLGSVKLTNVDTVYYNAFAYCSGMESLKLVNVDTLSGGAFSNCSGLKSLDLGNVRVIESGSFQGCTSLSDLYIPDSVQEIGGSPFIDCTGLRAISIGGVDTIKSGMLRTGSQVLETLTIRGTVNRIEDYALYSSQPYDSSTDSGREGYNFNTAFTHLIIEDGVQEIGGKAFYNCTSFVTAALPASLTSIGYRAFEYCTRLTDIFFFAGDVVLSTEVPFNGLAGGVTFHFGAVHEELQSYCDQKQISYDFITDVSCQLTLNGCGGTINGQPQAILEASLLSAPVLPTPVWAGHDFSGWYTDGELNNAWGGVVTGSLALYASWDRDIYNLTLNLMGGDAAQSHYRVHAGDPVEFNRPVRDGYCFVGWALDPEGEKAFNGVMPAEDTALYACWSALAVNSEFAAEQGRAVLVRCVLLEDESADVYLPDTVNGLPLGKIAAGAFADCEARRVFIPASVTEIEAGAFIGSDTLKEICVSEQNTVYASDRGVVYSKDGAALICCPPAGVWYVNVPDGVTGIAPRALEDTDVTSVRLPSSLEFIGDRAFKGTPITQISLPAALESIGARAFSGCSSLSLMYTEASPAVIGENAFSGCNPFMQVFGPDTECALRTVIRDGGYMYNAHLLTVNYSGKTKTAFLQAGSALLLPENPDMGENLQFTGWFADEACETPFGGSTMPNSELTLWAGGSAIFTYETVTPDEGSAYLKITGCEALNSSPAIPSAIGSVPVSAIAAGSFDSRYTLITVPDSVTMIEEGAFAQGTVLICAADSFAGEWSVSHAYTTSERMWTLSWQTDCAQQIDAVQLHAGDVITLPGMTRSGYDFLGWFLDQNHTQAAETGVQMPACDTVLYAGWSINDASVASLLNDLSWEIHNGCVTVTGYTGSAAELSLPAVIDGVPVTAVGENAFAYQSTLTQVTLPDSIMEIGAKAFFGMHFLQQVTLSASLTGIPDEAFAGCVALEQILLPEGITAIGAGAFENTGLTSVTLPASLTSIHATALLNCPSLTAVDVAFGNAFYKSRDGVLFDFADGVLLKYPAGRASESYTVSGTWSVGPWAFCGAKHLKNITLSGEICSLGKGAFAQCVGLTAMPELGAGITRIPDKCFYGCRAMREATLSSAVVSIGNLAFANTGLSILTIPDSVNYLGEQAVNPSVLLCGTGGGRAQLWAQANGVSFMPVGAVLAESLTFDSDTVVIKRGEKLQLALSVAPAEASSDGIVFYSSDASVAQVDDSGKVHGIGGGTAKIFASAPGGANTVCTVTVEVDVEMVAFTMVQDNLTIGEMMTIQAMILPAKASDQTLIWSSSAPDVAAVNDAGQVIAAGSGSAVIRAASSNGLFCECTITVSNPAGTLILPAALTVIGEEAFAEDTMSCVVIGNHCSEIQARAFAECPNLGVVVIPNSVVSISQTAFENSANVIILCHTGSAAETFAADNTIACLTLP